MLDPTKNVLAARRGGGGREAEDRCERYEEISANYSDDTRRRVRAPAGPDRRRRTCGSSTSRSRSRWTRCACPPGDADVTTLSGGEKRRVALCRLLLQPARHAAPRRAHEPPRRRVGGVARALPEGVPGQRRRGHPRPLLPRQRGRLDPRARPRRRHPLGGQLLVLARAEGPAPDPGGEGGLGPPPDARARARVDPPGAARAAGQGQGPHHALRGDAGGGAGGGEARRQARDRDPARAAPRRRRDRREGPAQGLRRQPADGRRQLHAAARRHRRRDRPERRRQDDALPHDRRPGEARRRRAEGRRDGGALLRRPAPRRPDRGPLGLGGDLGRRQGPRSWSASAR